MVVERLKTAIDSCWAKHKAFRIAFIAVFMLSVTAVSICAFLVFPQFFGWLVLVFVSIYHAEKYRAEPRIGFRGKYWWLPLEMSALSMAFYSINNYILNQIASLVFSATLCLTSIVFLVYYFKRKVAR